jgi:hypothetical protein
MGVKEIGCEGMDGVNLFQDKKKWCTVVNMVLILWIPGDSGVGFSGLRYIF